MNERFDIFVRFYEDNRRRIGRRAARLRDRQRDPAYVVVPAQPRALTLLEESGSYVFLLRRG